MAQPHKKSVTIDVNEFIRTRDALSSAYMSLSGSIDRAVKAYLDHTNVVLASDSTLDVSYLTQPFNVLAQSAAHTLNGAVVPLAVGAPAPALDTELDDDAEGNGKRKKRPYKPRDPNAPKRPLTAYFQYLKGMRNQIASEMAEKNGGDSVKPGEISEEATRRWKALDEAGKQVWRDVYDQELAGYEERSRAYKISIGAPLDEDDPVKTEKKAIAKAKRDAKKAAAVSAGAAAEDSSSSDSSSDDDSDDEKAAPPPAKSPASTKKTPKSALKKKADVPPTPMFSSINNNATKASASKSPELKRKAPAAATGSAEAGPKKRGRKTNAEKAAAAAADATPAKSVAADDKKDKKKKKKSDA